jgi:HAD superfamily hydrolase (TIGR01456 family)
MKLARFGVALDIDGVLLRGSSVIPGAQRALSALYGNNALKRRFPVIFLTNGGGVTEAAKARELEHKLGIPISPDQVVLSHSPMRALIQSQHNLNNGHVLLVGRDSVRDVAESYGMRHPVLVDEILRWKPGVWPYRTVEKISPSSNFDAISIQAVVVFHDSHDWGRDIQVCCDVLRSEHGILGTLSPYHHTPNFQQAAPIYFSNPDFVWANDFPVVRFGQGAFRKCLETMYKELTGHDLKIEQQFGKPMPATYCYAESVLEKLAERWTGRSASFRKHVFAVGDNIASDICGSNQHGWKSILVRTGVYKGNESFRVKPSHYIPNEFLALPNLKENVLEPNVICDDIEDAVDHIIRTESIEASEETFFL